VLWLVALPFRHRNRVDLPPLESAPSSAQPAPVPAHADAEEAVR